MKKQLLTLACISISLLIKAQTVMPQVVATSGGSGQNAQGSLSWTVGQTVISTVSGGGATLTQGFQQPTLLLPTSQITLDETLGLLIYPNPTADFVYLQTTANLSNTALQFSVFDATGKLVNQGNVVQQKTQVSFAGMAAGNYTISVNDKHSKSQNFSIIKQN